MGCTGFVGSNLMRSGAFDLGVHSTDVGDAFGTEPSLLVYAGLRAEKFLADAEPERDWAAVEAAAAQIESIRPKRLVLISTIDVYRKPVGVDEGDEPEEEGLRPYGLHRLRLERWARAYRREALIVRLPGLFGPGLKKNFIYDLLHPVPAKLTEARYRALAARSARIEAAYRPEENGMYARVAAADAPLWAAFEAAGFSALHFTDARAVFQFYPLARLWSDIRTALREGLSVLHPATEPIEAGALYRFLTGRTFAHTLPGIAPYYDFRTRYAAIFGGADGYLMERRAVMEAIRAFTEDAG